MNVQQIASGERYRVQEGWLDSKFHFSFDTYYDPANVHFGALRVFNDDTIAPSSGFPTHPHREMEIVTVMLEGTLQHRDSTGGQAILRAGDVQRMTAGTGIRHSEMNPDPATRAKLMQIWVLPETAGLAPGYEQKRFDPAERVGKLQRVVTRQPTGGELSIDQDADFHLGTLQPGQSLTFTPEPGRRQYLFVIKGSVDMNGRRFNEGDQGRITDADSLEFRVLGDANAELILIDLA